MMNDEECLIIEDGLKRGLTYEAIASLFTRPVSPHTVKNHVHRCGGRLNYSAKFYAEYREKRMGARKDLLNQKWGLEKPKSLPEVLLDDGRTLNLQDGRIFNGGKSRYQKLTFEDRKLIEEGISKGLTWNKIRNLYFPSRSQYTLRNEVNKNGGRFAYTAIKGQQRSDEQKEKAQKLLKVLYASEGDLFSKDGRFKRSVDERLYALEEQMKILFEIINK